MKVAYLTNSGERTGVGFRAANIRQLLVSDGIGLDEFYVDGDRGELRVNGEVRQIIKKWPGVWGSKTVNWVRLGLKTKKELVSGGYDIVHATNQTLSFIIDGSLPAVVTVHDIIEVLEPQSGWGGLAAKYLYSGIKRADHIIAVSEYTKKTIMDYYGVAAGKITVVYNGVGEDFYPLESFRQSIAYQQWLSQLKISAETRVILYVGSDHSRKNVIGAVRAFAGVKTALEDDGQRAVFVKVGKPGLAGGREQLLNEIDELGIKGSVKLIADVDNEQLNELYNLADVLIYPSRFEGFGLPVLQAFAAGTPVVTSNTTSLPEVTGDDAKYGKCAALVYNPDDIDRMAEGLKEILTDNDRAEELRLAGLERAKKFTWEKAVQKVRRVYSELAG
ncbi:MAG: glycosyltransferase family 1 protein [Candidatus Andersenbacteria bacterium]|nr:glycosyltransferase family 1 protein [bacterium]MDZ4225828.1 glycosyltransferase family 1 protein [Candidatus Andersenbacteria bacterium]